MAKNSEVAKKLGYEVRKRGGFYWFFAKQHSPACINAVEKFRVTGPFDTRAQAHHAAVIHYWNVMHSDPKMQCLLWTPN